MASKELVGLVKGLSVHHNGVEAVSYSVRLQEAIATNCRRSLAAWLFFSALSTKAREEEIIVLDGLTFDAPKTKEFIQVLSNLSIDKKALIVTADLDETVALSARNIPGISVVTANGINVLDLVAHDKLVITKAAVQKVEEVLG